MMKLNLRSPICVNMLKSIRHLSNLRSVNNIWKIQSINNSKNGSLKKISFINRRFFSSATESNQSDEKELKDPEEEQLEEKDERKEDKESKESKTEEELRKENENMVQKLATLEMKLKELEMKYKMCLSNCDNMCKIHKKEVENTKVYAVTEFAKGLLEVADTFELAFKHLNESENESEQSRDFVDGIKMTESMLQQTFEKFGIKKYESLNEEFNPQVHEAMFEVKDHKTHNKVIQVVKNGYMISGRILRPAKVGVSRK